MHFDKIMKNFHICMNHLHFLFLTIYLESYQKVDYNQIMYLFNATADFSLLFLFNKY